MRRALAIGLSGAALLASGALAAGLWIRALPPLPQPAALSYSTEVVDRDGGVWVGTTNGLARLDGDRVRTWGAAEGLPVMADAADQNTQGDLISYTSASALEDVVAFYQAEMPKAGWQMSGTSTEKQALAMFNYTKDGGTVSIVISWDPSAKRTTVVLDATRR